MSKPDPQLESLKEYLAEHGSSLTPEVRADIEEAIRFLDVPESERAVLVNAEKFDPSFDMVWEDTGEPLVPPKLLKKK